jgi:hypothetical protein
MKLPKLPKLPMWAWGAAGLVVFQQLKKRGAKVPPPPPVKPDGTEQAVTTLRSEIEQALVSPAWSAASKLQIKAADLALSGNPKGSLSQVVVAELVPRALGNAGAYSILKELPEDQRLAFAKEMAAPYGLFQLQKMVAFGGWTYLHFGGSNPQVTLQAQKYLGVPQTGVLDMATINQIKAITGRNIWSQVMNQVKA